MVEKRGNDAIVRLQANTQLFKDLEAKDLAACASAFRELRFSKGRVIFGRGDPPTYLYLVGEGRVRLAIATSEGRDLRFQIAVAGDLIGEIAVLDGGSRSAEATALTPVVAYGLERNAFRESRAAHASIADASRHVPLLAPQRCDRSTRGHCSLPLGHSLSPISFGRTWKSSGTIWPPGAAGAWLHAKRTRDVAWRKPTQNQCGPG